MNRLLLTATGLLACVFTAQAMAAPPQALTDSLTVNGESMPVEQVLDTPVQGLWEVHLANGESFYSDASGEHFVVGDIYKNGADGLVNLSEQSRNAQRAARIAEVPDSEQVIFRSDEAPKATIYVFTDTTCPYCQRLHEEVPALNEMGIAVHYLAFPRAGAGSEGARLLSQVWCAANPAEAMSAAKRGEALDIAPDCDNLVESQYHLGMELGVQGTPAIVMPDGRLVPGYVPAERLAEMLDLNG